MNRVRPVEALLAALATLAITLPLTTLFTPSTWFRPSALLVVVVALVGMGLRRITTIRPLVVLGQLLVLVHATSLLHGRGHLFGGVLPVPETGRAFGVLLQEAQSTVTNYTAPAPSNRGTILAISLLIGLTAVAVDAIGVTYRSPALAGIPLLSAFLASATNSGDGLGAWFAVPAALAWLDLVGRQGVRSLRAWGTASPHSSSGSARRPDHGLRHPRPGGRGRRARRGDRAAGADPALPHDLPGRRPGPQRRRARRVGLERAARLEHRHRPRPGQPLGQPRRRSAARPTGSSRCASASSTPTVEGSGSRVQTSPSCPSTGRSPVRSPGRKCHVGSSGSRWSTTRSAFLRSRCLRARSAAPSPPAPGT